MATVCPSPHSPLLVRGGHLYTRSTSMPFADAPNISMKNVVFAALGRGQARHAGGKASWGWAAGGTATIYKRDAT
eukprot:scaffold63499_cov63-Phaeocystis_antarctica.AAC.3